MTRIKTKPPFHDDFLDSQVRRIRREAMDVLLHHGAAVPDEGARLPDRVAALAGFSTELLDEDPVLYDRLARVHAVSYALGVAVGQLAPWIGTGEKKGWK